MRLSLSVVIAALCVVLTSCVSVPLSTTRRIHNTDTSTWTGEELSIVSINMLHGFSDRLNDRTLDARLSLLTDELVERKPDIVLLQEASVTARRRHGNVVDRLVDSLNRRLEHVGIRYNSVFYPAHGSRLIGFFEGEAVLSRYEITAARSMRYRAQALLPPEARIAVVATIAGAPGPIRVVSTHLTNREAMRHGVLVRTLQARELSKSLRSLDEGMSLVIIGGDFNSTPDSEAIAAMRSAGAIDVWDAGGRRESSGSTSLRGAVDDPTASFGRRIDYLFVYGGETEILEVRRIFDSPRQTAELGPMWISDHAGVFVRIRVTDRSDE